MVTGAFMGVNVRILEVILHYIQDGKTQGRLKTTAASDVIGVCRTNNFIFCKRIKACHAFNVCRRSVPPWQMD